MDWLVFLIYLGACAAAAVTGSAFQPGDWYRGLDKPRWTPPNWLFPVAWTVLYISMALAAARISAAGGGEVGLALWALQIALNTLWTPVFFGLRNIRGGLIVIVALWVSVAACAAVFWRMDALAGGLMSLYLLWVSYAAALNLSIWRRNPRAAAATI